jgi:hypothetical protein
MRLGSAIPYANKFVMRDSTAATPGHGLDPGRSSLNLGCQRASSGAKAAFLAICKNPAKQSRCNGEANV